MKILASGPVTSWQIDGETMETVRDFLSLGSKITADGDCSHEIKRCLLLGRKVMTILGSILKSRGIILPTRQSQSYSFSSSHIQMWELDHKEGWALKNWMLSNCGAREDSWESLGLQGDPNSLSKRKSVLNIHWKDCCWSSNSLAPWCEELTLWTRLWCLERAGGEGDDRK